MLNKYRLHMAILSISVLVLTFFTVGAHCTQLEEVPANCSSVLSLNKSSESAEVEELQYEVEKRLGFKTVLQNKSQESSNWIVLVLMDEGKKEVGFIEVLIERKGRLYISQIFVREPFREKGVSEYLFYKILRLVPGIREIESILTGENKKIAQAIYERGASCLEAIQATPAYKIRKKFGFSSIASAKCYQIRDLKTSEIGINFELTVKPF